MHLDPRRLGVLRAVANAGSVLAAAQVLRLTPSAVSQHIARLEAETGVILLDRSRLGGRRAVGLTPAGRLLAQHADRVADALAEAERDLAALTGQVTGTVVVGAFPSAIRHLAAPAAADLASQVRVCVRQIESEPGVAALRAGALDLLLVDSDAADPPLQRSGLRTSPLLHDPYQLAVPAQWGPVNDVEDLLARPWVDGSPGSVARRSVDRIAAHYDVTLDRPYECLEYPPALALVGVGLAVAVVPALALAGEADSRWRLLPAAVLGARRVDLVHRHGRHGPGAAARLVAGAIQARAVGLGRRLLDVVAPPSVDDIVGRARARVTADGTSLDVRQIVAERDAERP